MSRFINVTDSGGEKIIVNIDHILYVQYKQRKVYIRLIDGAFCFLNDEFTFERLQEMLEEADNSLLPRVPLQRFENLDLG